MRSLHEAILVSAAESEHRQDWSEAARAFLAGVGSNGSDADMEHGFQVNVQMLRSVRVRGTRRPEANKWDDVLTFKPKPPPERPPSPTSKHPWYRLGPAYEELVGCEAEGPALLGDLLAALPDEDAAAARDDLRHVLYDNMDFISELCARRPPPPAAARRRPPPAARGHARAERRWRLCAQVRVLPCGSGGRARGGGAAGGAARRARRAGRGLARHDPRAGAPRRARARRAAPAAADALARAGGARQLWRLLKECQVVAGGVKVKPPIAVFTRVHAQGRRRAARLALEDPEWDAAQVDPHERTTPVPYYDFVETLVRIACFKVSAGAGVAQRLDAFLREALMPRAMLEVTDRDALLVRDASMRAAMFEDDAQRCLRKAFDYYVSSYKANKIRVSSVGPLDVTMTFNHLYVLFEKLHFFDPEFSVKRIMHAYCKAPPRRPRAARAPRLSGRPCRQHFLGLGARRTPVGGALTRRRAGRAGDAGLGPAPAGA